MAKKEYTLREHFNDFKVIHKLKKKRSPMIIEILSEPKEDWFVEVIRYKRTDKKIVSHSMIVQAQVEDWVDRFKRLMGYENAES